VGEVSNMAQTARAADSTDSTNKDKVDQDKTGQDDTAPSVRFRQLPERVRPEDMIATQETEAPPEPTMGRDTERDFMLRNAGF